MSNVIPTNTDIPSRPSRQRRAVAALSASGVCIVLAVIIFAMPTSIFPLTGVSPVPTPVKDWQTYNDPSGHFTMRMPADWQKIETDHGSTGFAGTSFHMTTYWFGPRDQIQNTPLPITFTVDIMPIETAKQQSVLCRIMQTPDYSRRQIGNITA